MKIARLLLILFCAASVLSGCAVTGRSELKRSSSNKLFDTDGFHSNKRRPLYNKKYITKAKQNIRQDDYDEDEDPDIEYEDASTRNVKMYKGMMDGRKKDKRDRLFSAKKQYQPDPADDYNDLDLVASRKRLSRDDGMRDKVELEREIADIKEMLKKTRDEITKAKCPYTDQPKKAAKSRPTYDPDEDDDLDEEMKAVKPKKPFRAKAKEIVPAPKHGAMTSVIKD